MSSLTPKTLFLMHANKPYDAIKAHEYYMRTRQLKGRPPGRGRTKPASSFKKATAPAPLSPDQAKHLELRRQAIQKQIGNLEDVYKNSKRLTAGERRQLFKEIERVRKTQQKINSLLNYTGGGDNGDSKS